jgi:hypothetical protein
MTANSPTPVSCVFRLGFIPAAIEPLGQLEERRPMYSPRIKDDLIPLLYRIAKHEGKPMTRLVDEILRPEIERRMQQLDPSNCKPGPNAVSESEHPYQPKKNSIRTTT